MSFWSTEFDWRRIWAKRWWIVGILLAMYVFGLTVNRGPSMNGLGWVYFHLWFTQPENDGDIFVFVPADKPAWTKFVPGCQWVKRRIGVMSDGSYIFEGDNSEWSDDHRDLLAPVPPSHVAGAVWAAISRRRIANLFTPQGRFDNQLAMHVPPSWVIYREGEKHYAIHRPMSGQTTVDGRTYDVFLTGGEPNNPILVDAGYTKAYRIREGRLVETKVVQQDSFAVYGQPKAVKQSAKLGVWSVTGDTLPLCDNPLDKIVDGNPETGWFAPTGLRTRLVIDFGKLRDWQIKVTHPGRAAGDVAFAISTDGLRWEEVSPSLRGFKPSEKGIPRSLGIHRCRYLWIGNRLSSATIIYEVTAK